MNLLDGYVAGLGFKLATPGSAVKHTAKCAMEPGQYLIKFIAVFERTCYTVIENILFNTDIPLLIKT